jgi:suppressor of tumorigenicity protein 13
LWTTQLWHLTRSAPTESPQDIPPAESADAFSNDEGTDDDDDDDGNEPPFPPMYESGDDFDKASDLKMAANDLKSNGDFDGALAKYSEAVQAAEPSALLYANRADCLQKLGRPRAAVNDCNAALNMNPDSAKALRIRGTAYKDLGKYEEALKDLSASQAIDYNDSAAEDLKFCTEKHMEHEKELAKKRNEEKDKLLKKAEEIKKAQEEAKREAAASASARASGGGMGGGMPGFGAGGMPGGGMGGMPGGLGGLMNDPEVRRNPRQSKFGLFTWLHIPANRMHLKSLLSFNLYLFCFPNCIPSAHGCSLEPQGHGRYAGYDVRWCSRHGQDSRAHVRSRGRSCHAEGEWVDRSCCLNKFCMISAHFMIAPLPSLKFLLVKHFATQLMEKMGPMMGAMGGMGGMPGGGGGFGGAGGMGGDDGDDDEMPDLDDLPDLE